MAPQRNDILSELRLANFNRSPLKIRLELLLKLNAIGEKNEGDIADHAGRRLIEMDDEIKPISEENAENHAAEIKKWIDEIILYSKYPIIEKEHHQRLKSVRKALKPLQNTVIGKEEDHKLEELRYQFKQVPPVDWNSNDWLRNADQTIRTYKEIKEKHDATTWHVRKDNAEKLKHEIDTTIERIEGDAIRRRRSQNR